MYCSVLSFLIALSGFEHALTPQTHIKTTAFVMINSALTIMIKSLQKPYALWNKVSAQRLLDLPELPFAIIFFPSCYFLHMWFYLFIVVPYLSLKLKPPEHRIYPSTFLAYFCWRHNINSKQIVISISIPVCFCKLGVCVVVLGWITLIELTVFTCTGS